MEISNQHKYYEVILKEAFIQKVGIFLDKLMSSKIIVQTQAQDEFGIAALTLRRLRVGESSISYSFLRKMPYIFAYYLDAYSKKIKAEPNGYEKTKKLNALPALMAEFKDIYGYQATFCLEQIEKGKDLRAIVKQTTQN